MFLFLFGSFFVLGLVGLLVLVRLGRFFSFFCLFRLLLGRQCIRIVLSFLRRR